MIFVTLGTQESPFPRALELVRPLSDGDEIVVQHGSTAPDYALPGFRWMQFLSYDEVMRYGKSAEVFISHAGVGSIFTALSLGATPVVIPRLFEFGEAVDDHQLQIARALQERDLVVACFNGDIRSAVSRAAGSRGQRRPLGNLHAAVREATRRGRPGGDEAR